MFCDATFATKSARMEHRFRHHSLPRSLPPAPTPLGSRSEPTSAPTTNTTNLPLALSSTTAIVVEGLQRQRKRQRHDEDDDYSELASTDEVPPRSSSKRIRRSSEPDVLQEVRVQEAAVNVDRSAILAEEQRLPAALPSGSRLQVHFEDTAQWYCCTVMHGDGGHLFVKFDDGQREWIDIGGSDRSKCRPCPIESLHPCLGHD